MNRERAKELLPIIQAFAEGKTIQWSNDGNNWIDCEEHEIFANDYKFRIKPEPFECWVCVNSDEYPESVWLEKKYAETENAARTIHMREVE